MFETAFWVYIIFYIFGVIHYHYFFVIFYPLMKTTWGSWLETSQTTADSIGAEEGQLVRLESDHGTVEVSLLINDQLREGVVALPFGQGHTDYGRYAADRGINASLLLAPRPEQRSGGQQWAGTRVDAIALDVMRRIPRLQTNFDQDDRELAQTVSLAALAAGELPPAPHHSAYKQCRWPSLRPSRSARVVSAARSVPAWASL